MSAPSSLKTPAAERVRIGYTWSLHWQDGAMTVFIPLVDVWGETNLWRGFAWQRGAPVIDCGLYGRRDLAYEIRTARSAGCRNRVQIKRTFCAWCDHSNAERESPAWNRASHGICPKCAREHFPM